MVGDSLAQIYDSQAEKFSQTRRKHRPEMDKVIHAIAEHTHTSVEEYHLLEVGCGDGRLWDHLLQHIEQSTETTYHYTGVDISQGLLQIARERVTPAPHHAHYIHQDMMDYLQHTPDASQDIIVGIASVQHLFPSRIRQEFFSQAQRTLRPGGRLILTNRARSDRAREKYSRSRQHHLRQWIQTRGRRSSGDQLIPWIDPDTHQRHERYYHFFSLEELESHLATGWQIDTLTYIHRSGEQTSSVRQARNSLVIASTTG